MVRLLLIKKNESEDFSDAEKRRYEDIVTIQKLLADGYAPVQIKELLHTTYNRIRRYAVGDPENLCRFDKEKSSGLDAYRDEIIKLLMQNMTFKDAMAKIIVLGYQGKRTAFGVYCRKLIAELGITHRPRKNAAGVTVLPGQAPPAARYISKSDVCNFLWSGKEINADDFEYIVSKYPKIAELQVCIEEFRAIYNKKDTALLDCFISKYKQGGIKSIQSFASGLTADLEAVKNSVTSDLSNGFVEGQNNKIKAIKRLMFGRAKIGLLRVKVLFAR